jgi:hypothetical protein
MSTKTKLAGAAAVVALALAPTAARADSIIKNPGDHPDYVFELEPHLLFGWHNYGFGGTGLGLGARGSVPLVKNGFVSTINNNVAITFGLDWLRYSDCYYNYYNGNRFYSYGCGASYLQFPVAMQWNFWLTEKWSVFGEPGLYIWHGFYDTTYACDPRFNGCYPGSATGVDFAFWAGGRFHFNDKISLTMRIGYPTFSFGVSFFL